MVIVHRVSLRATEAQRRKLQALGVNVPAGVVLPGGGDPHVAFDVGEDHPNWDALQRLFREWDVGDFVSTRFSKEEIGAAKWLNLVADWHYDYPQPDELEFGYLRATYDLSEWCDACGIGLKQKAPFQMKSEPKWGRRAILQLNWVFDEYFATPEVWSNIFKPHGIACRSVTNTKGAELKTVVQLVVEEDVGIVIDGLVSERCAKCGRVRYLPVTRGFFPALAVNPTRAIVKTREYFGSGAAAHKRVLVSQDLARALVAAKVRGVSFWPVQSPEGVS
jgi:rRNA maturation protein Nop10